MHFSVPAASVDALGMTLTVTLVELETTIQREQPDLVAGSGVGFLESREAELKGLDGSHRLYAVDLT